MIRWLFLIIMMGLSPAMAVEPDEILDDPLLEDRARNLSQGLRCLVCQNESIDESNAPLARDLRILLRERLLAGDSDAEAMNFIVARYGEFVLLQPTIGGSNLILWAAGPAMALVGLVMALLYIRRRKDSKPVTEIPLNDEEKARLDEILKG